MRITRERAIRYRSVRPGAHFDATYRPAGPARTPVPGTLEHWLTERYCLYTMRRSKVSRVEIDHVPWPLQPARLELSRLDVAEAAGLSLMGPPAQMHFAASLDVWIWPPVDAGSAA